MRVARAQTEHLAYADALFKEQDAAPDDPALDDGTVDKALKAAMQKLREKYGIPAEVYLFGCDDAALIRKHVAAVKPYVEAFVRGKLTAVAVAQLLFYFEELAECDYGWILLERPCLFYTPDEVGGALASITMEIVDIGTRSPKKKIGLPPLTGVPLQLDDPVENRKREADVSAEWVAFRKKCCQGNPFERPGAKTVLPNKDDTDPPAAAPVAD